MGCLSVNTGRWSGRFLLLGLLHGVLDHGLQLALFQELQGDVTPADQLPVDIDLGEGRPVGVTVEVLEEMLTLPTILATIRVAESSERI